MIDQIHFTSVRFHRFKSFREYSVQLREFNVMVGANKRMHSMLNRHLQAEYSISLSAQAIIACFEKRDIPAEIENFIDGLDDFRQESPPSER